MAPTYKEAGKTITRHSRADLDKLQSETDWARVDGMTDAELMANAAPDPDSAPADIVWNHALTLDELLERQKKRKQSVTIRLSAKTLAFFKKKGKGYQTRISALLDLIVEQEEEKERARYAKAYRVPASADKLITHDAAPRCAAKSTQTTKERRTAKSGAVAAKK